MTHPRMLALLTGLLLAGCASPSPVASMKDQEGGKTLYERLGGEAALQAVVDDFVGRAAANPKVNFTRKGTEKEWTPSAENVAKLKAHLVQFLSTATGGPHKYEGRAMKPVHSGMGITEAEFGALAGDLIASLDKFKVPQKERDELIAIVASTRKDIVEK